MVATTTGSLLLLLIILVGFAMMIGGPRAVRGLFWLILLPVRLVLRPLAVVALAIVAVAVALSLVRPVACARIGSVVVPAGSPSPVPTRTAPPYAESLSGLFMPLPEGFYRVGQPFLGTSLNPDLLHLGQDYGVSRASSEGRALTGTLLYSVGEGRVVAVRYGVPARGGDGVGNYVTVDYGGGRVAVYMHLARVWVAENEEVHARSLLGEAGDVLLHPCPDYCPHLHLEIRARGDQALNVPPNLRYSYASKDGKTRFSKGFDSEADCVKWIVERFLDPAGLSPRPASMSPSFDLPDAVRALLDAGHGGWRPAAVSRATYERCLGARGCRAPQRVRRFQRGRDRGLGRQDLRCGRLPPRRVPQDEPGRSPGVRPASDPAARVQPVPVGGTVRSALRRQGDGRHGSLLVRHADRPLLWIVLGRLRLGQRLPLAHVGRVTTERAGDSAVAEAPSG